MNKKRPHPKKNAASISKTDFTQDSNKLRLSTGRAAREVQKRLIRFWLELPNVKRTPLEWLEVAGTDAVRAISAPYKNPLEYVSDFRALNGWQYLESIKVPEARNGRGKPPVYYRIPVKHRELFIKLMEES